MDPPRFDGSDAANWISRVQYYFDHLLMPEDSRLHYVVMMFDPPAADWIFNYCANNPFATWHDFLEDVRHRFDPQCYENHIGLLAKLCQTGTLEEYHTSFEKLLNRISGIPESTLLPIYIAGLKQLTQRDVKLHCPTSLASAFLLAQELSANLTERQPPTPGFSRRPWVPREQRLTPSPLAIQQQPSHQTAQPNRPLHSTRGNTNLSKLPIVRLSSAEMSDRSRKGLCWYCEERWAPGHVCKHKFLAYMGADDDSEDDSHENEHDQLEDTFITADISHMHAMEGKVRSKAITIRGSIGSTDVTVLIDTGSSHDFLHPCVA